MPAIMSNTPTQHESQTSGRVARLRNERSSRAPSVTIIATALLLLLASVGAWFALFAPGGRMTSNVIDFTSTAQRIQEISTVRSHLRFAVVVREEAGNIIVRRLADQSEDVGMNDLTSMLFQDPTMIVELHGVATYGMHLADLDRRVRQTDSTVVFALPPADVLDVKLVAADTRIVAQMQGLLRSSRGSLLQEANRQGEEFVLQMARQDTTLRDLAAERTRDLLSLLVERTGKRAIFR